MSICVRPSVRQRNSPLWPRSSHGYPHGRKHDGGKFLVDIAENVAPVNFFIGKNAIEYVLMAVKEGLKRTANIVRNILYGEEREENHHQDHLSAGELAVWFLFESHLPFRDVYGFKTVHYPLRAESAATLCEKIAQLQTICLSVFMLGVYFCLDTLTY